VIAMVVAARELVDELEQARRDLLNARTTIAMLVQKAGGRVELTFEDRVSMEHGAHLAVWDDMERMCTVLSLRQRS
jgi:hypothetical protein